MHLPKQNRRIGGCRGIEFALTTRAGSGCTFMRSKGFTLIELLIVVALIAVIASVAVPNFVRSKTAANESSAINSVRTLITAQVTYASTIGAGQFATLGNLEASAIVDDALGSGTKDEYNFTVTPLGNVDFTIVAVPTVVGLTGDRGFYGDGSGVIRYTTNGTAPDSSSPPLGAAGS